MVNELGKLHTVNSEGMCISYYARLSMHCAVPLRSKTIFMAGGRVVHEGKASYSSLTEHLQL